MRKISKVFVASILFLVIVVSTFAVGTMVLGQGSKKDGEDSGFCESGAVFYLGKDNITQGDWQNALRSPIGVYGSYAHILPNPPKNLTEIPVGNFSVPVGGFDYTDYGWTPNQISGLPFNRTDPSYWDEYVSLDPKINYTLTGTLQYLPSIGTIQYPVFEWAWDDFNSSDPRAVHFKTFPPNVTRLTCWDDGSERDLVYSMISEGYFNVTMDFPEGVFMLSLYAYDKSVAGRPNQTIYITNEAGEVLVSAVMEGAEFDGGIYLQFLVCGPTTIVVQVMRGPESVNAVLSGIFVDKLPIHPRMRTIGFWKTNLAKLSGIQRGRAQVDEEDMESYILFASTRCSDVFGGISTLEDAYLLLDVEDSALMLNKAKAQFYALLLNVASKRGYETDVVGTYLYEKLHTKYPLLGLSDYPFTLEEVINTSCDNIKNLANLEFTKDICDVLNNGY